MRPAREVMLERWDEVDVLFREVLEKPEVDRRGFLLSSCAGDEELFDTVSTLLDSTESGPDPLAGPGEAILQAALADADEEPPTTTSPKAGDTVGRYRLVRELGRGGMATVYEAERADGAFQRTVAIKLLRGVDTDDLVQRFLVEREILSSLDHPNIAGLLDGGTTPEGRPFLVMEMVDGEPLTSWADRQNLSVPRRVDLILDVAEAVQYAHNRLVVHRDIKPSNVLVRSQDQKVKLLDFGIAKLLDTGGEHPPETRAFTRWMTPQYASPEQIQGQPVTTATDVHALGVLLYELLTGRRPFGQGEDSDFELGRSICEEIPRLPSAAVSDTAESMANARGTTPRRLQRTLQGDLDAIVSKALRKNPEDRFPSVQAMLDDLRRYRTGRAVQAREGMWAYRARKFMARHWLGVGASAAIFATLIGSSLVLAIQQRQTEQERDRANQAATQASLEAGNAQLVIGFLADVFRGRDPNQAPSDTLTARELLAWGTEKVETEFSDRPEIRSELYAVMGGAHFNLGLFDEGVVLYERAVEAMASLFGEESEEVADVLGRLAEAHKLNGNLLLALPYFERSLELNRKLYGPTDERVANVLIGLGTALRDVELADSAEVLLREAVRIGGELTTESSTAVEAALGLAYVLRGRGELDEAEALYEDAIPKALDLPEIIEAELATHLNNLAYLRRLKGNYEGARALYVEALNIQTTLRGRGHPNSLQIGNNLASALNFLGRMDEALDVLAENVDAALAQWPEGHWRVGSAHTALGRAFLRGGRPEEAKEPLLAGVQSYAEQLGDNHNWTNFAAVAYRIAQIQADDDPVAREALNSFFEVLKGTYDRGGGVLSPDLVTLLEPLVFVLQDTDLHADTERFKAMMPRG